MTNHGLALRSWRGGSLPLYSQAAANTRLVGMEVARMVEVSVSENKNKMSGSDKSDECDMCRC